MKEETKILFLKVNFCFLCFQREKISLYVNFFLSLFTPRIKHVIRLFCYDII